MANVTLPIGGRPHTVACRDGEEARLQLLGQMIEDRWPTALRAAGGVPGERAMLFVALMLADDLEDIRQRPPEGAAVSEPALARIADRLEALANALERDAAP
ncbi:cell division protein ZapA [Sphingomonas sp. RP10(2022)]|uniref:Cell division protein ZapA n=1 Tax=Sphingomonas liriopis TaxID=2949094 RepID=A0A9X2HLY8_9SPHN|nr:cell division protein ZapA [Sphingomonas liriopis]MCP3733388.1 cell division protein ZapA [Sphingomonas liriopis]